MTNKKEDSVRTLGHNFVFHFNEFQNLWYCIPRDEYIHYWNDVHNKKYSCGKTTEEAASKMLSKK